MLEGVGLQVGKPDPFRIQRPLCLGVLCAGRCPDKVLDHGKRNRGNVGESFLAGGSLVGSDRSLIILNISLYSVVEDVGPGNLKRAVVDAGKKAVIGNEPVGVSTQFIGGERHDVLTAGGSAIRCSVRDAAGSAIGFSLRNNAGSCEGALLRVHDELHVPPFPGIEPGFLEISGGNGSVVPGFRVKVPLQRLVIKPSSVAGIDLVPAEAEHFFGHTFELAVIKQTGGTGGENVIVRHRTARSSICRRGISVIRLSESSCAAKEQRSEQCSGDDGSRKILFHQGFHWFSFLQISGWETDLLSHFHYKLRRDCAQARDRNPGSPGMEICVTIEPKEKIIQQ